MAYIKIRYNLPFQSSSNENNFKRKLLLCTEFVRAFPKIISRQQKTKAYLSNNRGSLADLDFEHFGRWVSVCYCCAVCCWTAMYGII